MLFGFVICFVTSLVFGTVFVPIQTCPPTDGFTVQLFVCLGAYFSSFLIYAYLQFPGLFVLPMIGGAMWTIGNCAAVAIMSRLGMFLYILFASAISSIIGWAVSRFGLFGLPPSLPQSDCLNYVGIAILILGSGVYPFIKFSPRNSSTPNSAPPLNNTNGVQSMTIESSGSRRIRSNKDSLDKLVEKGLCWIGVVVSGVTFGLMTVPVTLMMTRRDLYPWAPESSLALHFSFFTGVVLVSIFLFMVYSLISFGHPKFPPFVILPAFLSGILFSTAVALLFFANQLLSPTISYPICMMAPGLMTCAWSVFYFHEITGTRNFILLSFAYIFTLIGVVLISISKDFQYF